MTTDNDINGWDVPAPQGVPGSEVAQVDLLRVALRRKGLLILGAFVGICLSYLQYVRTPPTFQSSAQMLIREKTAPLPTEAADQSFKTTAAAEDHAFVMMSPYLIEQAVIGKSLDKLRSFAGESNVTGAVRGGLAIAPLQEGSAVLSLSFQGADSDDCPTVLNAIMDTYRDSLNINERHIGATTVELIDDARRGLRAELETKEKAYHAWKQQEAKLFWQADQATNIHQQRQAEIERERRVVLLKNNQLESKIASIDAAIAQGVDRHAILLAANQDASSLEIPDETSLLEARLFPLLLEDEMLAQKYGRDHPKRKSVHRQIEFARRYHEQTVGVTEGDARKDKLLIYLDALRQELVTGKAEADRLNKLFENEQLQAEQLAKDEATNASYVNDIKRTKALFDAVVQRLQEINLLEAYGGDRYTVQTLMEPDIGYQVEPNLGRMLFVGLVMGTLSGFGLGYLFEKSEKTFRSAQDVSTSLRLPLVGHIPEISTKGQPTELPLSPALVTAHRPKSPQAEGFRSIRTAIYFSTRGQEHRVLQMTSPVPGDGKSTLIANLAIAIAQSGKSVLLLDADFRRPTQHKLFNLKMEVGLASVVDGQVEPPQAIQATPIENLSVMACGPRPHNPSELLTSPQFEDLLNLLRDQFDFVLVDTPPLLAVTDPGVVSARVDGVLLALRMRKKCRLTAIRARNILEDLDANVLGVIVNGLGGEKGSYGYYQSGYSYGYGYGYQYDYGDTVENAIERYYDDPQTASSAPPPKSNLPAKP